MFIYFLLSIRSSFLLTLLTQNILEILKHLTAVEYKTVKCDIHERNWCSKDQDAVFFVRLLIIYQFISFKPSGNKQENISWRKQFEIPVSNVGIGFI